MDVIIYVATVYYICQGHTSSPSQSPVLEEDKRATTNVQMVWSFSFYSLFWIPLRFLRKGGLSLRGVAVMIETAMTAETAQNCQNRHSCLIVLWFVREAKGG